MTLHVSLKLHVIFYGRQVPRDKIDPRISFARAWNTLCAALRRPLGRCLKATPVNRAIVRAEASLHASADNA